MTDMTKFSGGNRPQDVQGELDVLKGTYFSLVRQGRAIRENRDSIVFIWECLKEPQIMASAAMEAYDQLSKEDQIALWKAPSRGGIWEGWEREVLRQGEVTDLYFKTMSRLGRPVLPVHPNHK